MGYYHRGGRGENDKMINTLFECLKLFEDPSLSSVVDLTAGAEDEPVAGRALVDGEAIAALRQPAIVFDEHRVSAELKNAG